MPPPRPAQARCAVAGLGRRASVFRWREILPCMTALAVSPVGVLGIAAAITLTFRVALRVIGRWLQRKGREIERRG